MSRHVAIKKASCENCNVPAPVAMKRGLFGWGKTVGKSVEVEGKGGGLALPVQEIVRRRAEWLREIEMQEARKRRRAEEIARSRK